MCSLQLVEKVCEIAGFFLWNVFSRTCAGKKHRNPPNFRKNLAKPARRPEPNCREKPSEAVFRQSQESTNVLSFAYHRLTRGSMLSGGQNSRWASSSSLVGVSPPSSSSLPATIFARRKVRKTMFPLGKRWYHRLPLSNGDKDRAGPEGPARKRRKTAQTRCVAI